MRVVVARSVASAGALVSLALAVALTWGLVGARGVRSWDSPPLAVLGGVVLATAVAMAIVLAARTWQREMSNVGPVVTVAILLVAASAVGALLVLASTSTAYTPIAEIVE